MTITPQNDTAGLLEQAHLAMIRKQWHSAQSILQTLLAAEPANQEAQAMLAQVVAQQVPLPQDKLSAPLLLPPDQSGSWLSRPIPDPLTALSYSGTARKMPKPLLLVCCLAAGAVSFLLPSRHHHYYYHSSLIDDIAFGMLAGLIVFLILIFKKKM
jgi:hypothetical protein